MKFLALSLLVILLPSGIIVPLSVKAENMGTGNVNIAFWEDIDNLNPHIGPTRADAVIFTYLYATLYELDEDLNLIPWLAESHEMINETTWIFHLVQNASWHDGQPLTAYDVEFTFEMLINGSVNFPGMWFSACKDIEKVTAIDQYTVRVDMKLPRAQILDFVGRAVPIVAKHIYEDLPEPYKSQPWLFLNLEHPIGCGPFKFKSRSPGEQIVLESNQDFFRLKYRPKINTMTFKVISNLDVALLALQRGEVDVVLQEVPPSVFDAIRTNPAAYPMIRTSNVSDISTSCLAFNLRLYPYNITDFRRAISHAIDINRIIDKIWLGYAIPGSPGYAPPKWSWRNPNIKPYGYNLSLAEEMLNQSGFSVGSDGKRKKPDGTPFTMKILCENDEVARI